LNRDIDDFVKKFIEWRIGNRSNPVQHYSLLIEYVLRFGAESFLNMVQSVKYWEMNARTFQDFDVLVRQNPEPSEFLPDFHRNADSFMTQRFPKVHNSLEDHFVSLKKLLPIQAKNKLTPGNPFYKAIYGLFNINAEEQDRRSLLNLLPQIIRFHFKELPHGLIEALLNNIPKMADLIESYWQKSSEHALSAST
jgi:hypothetical protein